MIPGQMRLVLRHLRKLVGGPEDGASADGALLARFADQADESAFEELLRRHAGLVLGVCRRVLGDDHAAEDAFQATFLVLLRKAGSLQREGPLAPWLYTVAYHTAVRARGAAARRQREERQVSRMATVLPEEDAVWRDLRLVLDEELNRLGDKYRAPVVLCYLEGKTHEEAARALGWPRGTVAGRLSRAKALLRQRLQRRGVTLSGCAPASSAELPAPPRAPVPPALLACTMGASVLFLAGQSASAGAFSAQVVALGEAVFEALAAGKAKALLLGLLTLILAGGGLGVGRWAPVERPAVVWDDRPTCRGNPSPPVRAIAACTEAKDGSGASHMAKPLVSDELWEQIEALLPAPKPRRSRHPGRRPLEPRKVLTGIVFVLKSGIPWEELPAEMGCGCGMTCLNYLKAWQQTGTWRKIQEALLAHLPGAERLNWARGTADAVLGAPVPAPRPVVAAPGPEKMGREEATTPPPERGSWDGGSMFPPPHGENRWAPPTATPMM